MPEILLRSKIGIPHHRRLAVSRPRLLQYSTDALVDGNQFLRKLTLISAPAGYGKTTIAVEWLRALGSPVAWLSLDEGDNDPARFMGYIIAAIQSVRPGFGQATMAMVQAPRQPPAEVLLTLVLNELETRPDQLILGLDDYHVINNVAIHQQISFLLEHLPANIHLVLITREDPLVPIAGLRAKNQVLEIRQDRLRFTVKETDDFMYQVMQLKLTDAEIHALEQRTEGWIAGLQLVGITLQGLKDKGSFIQEFTGSSRFILDYLMEEVVNRQPGNVRDFLLQTSILERLCGPLCEAVTGQRDASELLKKLDQGNMFIVPLDNSQTWYRYHHLFAELLRHQQQSGLPVDTITLHQRASQWFETAGYLPEAIQHTLQAGDWTKAAALIGRVNDGMFKRGEIVTVIGWLEKLPEQFTFSQPELCMAYAWALLLTEKYAKAGIVLAKAQKIASSDSFYQGQVANGQAYLARAVGDNLGVIRSSQMALSLLPEDDHSRRGSLLMNLGIVYWHEGNLEQAEKTLVDGQEKSALSNNLYAQLTCEVFLARTLASRGFIREAATKYQSVLQRGSQVPISTLAYFDLGALHYEWNELDKAELFIQQGMDLGRRTRNVEFQVAGLIVQAYVWLARQDWTAAASIADQAYALGENFSAQTRARCAACQAHVALAVGDLKNARHWLEQFHGNVDSHPFFRFSGLLQARLLIAQGHLEAAADELKLRYETAFQAGWGYALAAIRARQALAAGSSQTGLDYLADALRMAEPEGYVRTFTDAGLGLIPILRDAAQQGITPGYVKRILTSMDTHPSAPASTRSMLVEPLSEREIEVLRLVTAGLSNREIAGKLFISPGTAKTHVHNLYGKLGVRSRIQAAARAKELGLD